MESGSLRVVPASLIAKRHRIPEISGTDTRNDLRPLDWWPVARTADGMTVLILIEVGGVVRVAGFNIRETQDSVTLDVLGEVVPPDVPRTLPSITREYVIELPSPIAGRRLLRTQ